MNETARRVKRSRFAIICAPIGMALAAVPAFLIGSPLVTMAGAVIGGIVGGVLDRRYPPYEPSQPTEGTGTTQ
jgi:hypothetical protein